MRAFLLSVFVFWGLAGIAQPLGLRSARTNLNYIESDTVRIIYEVGQEEQARRVADVVHHMAKNFPISTSPVP